MSTSLKLPSEIVAEQVLPTLRVRLARELTDRGFTQQQIADLLGVTQAAVSQYVSEENSVVARIDEGEMDGYEALDELLSLIRMFEDRGPICELHEEAMPALEGLSCDLCMRGTDEQLATEREVLANPEFGASRHVATVVLAAMAVDHGMRGALNLATDDDILDTARQQGIEPIMNVLGETVEDAARLAVELIAQTRHSPTE